MWPLINTNQKIEYNLDIDIFSKWVSATPSAMACDSFFYVQEAGHFRCGPDYFTERENLQSFLVKCTLSGQGQIKYRGKLHELCCGDVFFIRCDEYQRYQTLGESWEQIWVHFNGAGSNNYFQQFYQATGSCVVKLAQLDAFADTVSKIIALYRVGGI